MTRVANVVPDSDDPGQYVQVAEVVDFAWLVNKPASRASGNDRYQMT